MALQDDFGINERNLRTLARWRSTARVLVEALPNILKYDGTTIVAEDNPSRRYYDDDDGPNGVGDMFS